MGKVLAVLALSGILASCATAQTNSTSETNSINNNKWKIYLSQQ